MAILKNKTKNVNHVIVEIKKNVQWKEATADRTTYKAKIKTKNEDKIYIGLSAKAKEIKSEHQCIRWQSKVNQKMQATINTWTQLNYPKNTSIKREKNNYELEWKIISIVNKSKSGTRTCKLCLIEVLTIL